MDDLIERKKSLLLNLKAEMKQALLNNQNVRLIIENMNYMNLTYLVTREEFSIDLDSFINEILNESIDGEPHLKSNAEDLGCPKCQSSLR